MGLGNWLKKKGNDSKRLGEKIVNADELKQTGHNIKDMASVVLSPKEQIEHAKEETFQQAKSRLKVSDLDLIQTYKNYAYVVYASLLFTLICFLGALYYLFFEHSVFSAFAMISIMLLCMANAFKFSFRAFQIKHQKLCSVKEWWERAGEWLPKI